ncbi:unnamed protein product [Diamesa serratosioi]
MKIIFLLIIFCCISSLSITNADQYSCSNKCKCYSNVNSSKTSEIFCPSKNDFKMSLNIDVTSETYSTINDTNFTVLTVSCNNANNSYFVESLASVALKKEDHQMIEKLQIQNCSLPQNESIKVIFDKFQVQNVIEIKYRIQEYNQERPLNTYNFDGMRKLEKLLIYFDKYSSNFLNVFKDIEGTKSLTIQGQIIINSTKELFKDLNNVAELTLINNHIAYIAIDFFEYLPNLIKLVITSNSFNKMSSDAFQNIPLLLFLECNYNRIALQALPTAFFKNMHELRSIAITGLDARHLSESIFDNFTSLVDICLSENFHRTLSNNTFSKQRKLEKLNLNKNTLEKLPDDLFKSNNKLKILRLSFNMLKNISSILFDGLVNLEELYLDNNRIHSINKISQLSSVRFIDLHNNQLRPVDGGRTLHIFQQLKNLTHLVLNNNSLELTYIHLENSVENIDLSCNLLLSCPIKLSSTESRNLTINLKNNYINLLTFMRTINLIDVSVKRTVNLLVDNNELNCDCNAIDFIRLVTQKLMFKSNIFEPVKFHFENMHCTSPPNMKSTLVHELKPIDLKCDADGCAFRNDCDCYKRIDDQTLVINCTNLGMKTFPNITLPLSHHTIFIEHFYEKDRDILNYDKHINLTSIEMILTNNSITQIDKIPDHLRILDIEANAIKSLNNQTLEHLKKYKTKVLLSRNPWKCDCTSKDFITFLRQNPSIFIDYEKMSCADSTKIIDLRTEDLCIDYELIIIILSAILLVILFATLAVYFKFQKLIKMWCFAHNICIWFISEDELDDDKIYDAFVVFAAPDQQLVEHLLDKLENEYNYKLCVHLRDWAPGELIVTQVFNSIRDSRRTIVILSPHFHASRWARFEFRVSLLQAFEENRSRVIIIINGDLDQIEDMDEDLEAYLKLNTYININDRWFWEKMKYALPHTKRESNNLKIKDSSMAINLKNSENETTF